MTTQTTRYLEMPEEATAASEIGRAVARLRHVMATGGEATRRQNAMRRRLDECAAIVRNARPESDMSAGAAAAFEIGVLERATAENVTAVRAEREDEERAQDRVNTLWVEYIALREQVLGQRPRDALFDEARGLRRIRELVGIDVSVAVGGRRR